LFFFSSRRRHTRSKRDWSSDVCSSDLSSIAAWIVVKFRPVPFVIPPITRTIFRIHLSREPSRHSNLVPARGSRLQSEHKQLSSRSEERRVGKESSQRPAATGDENQISN